MKTISLHFTRRPWNPISFLIRWAMPRTRFALAHSSHVIIEFNGWCYEAKMLGGVRPPVRVMDALKNYRLVRTVQIEVLNLSAGRRFARKQIGAGYDYKGAFGLALAPDRDWADPSNWFCYEYAAAVLRAAGRPVGVNLSHVSETALLSLSPKLIEA